jgi:hypothetical protein
MTGGQSEDEEGAEGKEAGSAAIKATDAAVRRPHRPVWQRQADARPQRRRRHAECAMGTARLLTGDNERTGHAIAREVGTAATSDENLVQQPRRKSSKHAIERKRKHR